MSDDVPVVIFAGGEGSRLGGGKPLRILHGERLIDGALRQARRWSKLIAVSIRSDAQVQSIDAKILIDEPGIEGPLGGLASALSFGERSGCDVVLTIAVDMPFLPFDLLDRLFPAIAHRGCALASSGGHLHPVCGLWRTAAEREIGRYAANGRRSLKGFAELIGFEAVEWPAEPLDTFFNINTAADLARAERMS
jgi:molybdopterin-guanine dinucleotide biosynthesis protein A